MVSISKPDAKAERLRVRNTHHMITTIAVSDYTAMPN
jgi:hypothetical protein